MKERKKQVHGWWWWWWRSRLPSSSCLSKLSYHPLRTGIWHHFTSNKILFATCEWVSLEFCSCRCRIQMRCIVCTLMQEESTWWGVVATVSNFLLKLFGDWHPTLLLAFRNLSPTCRFFLWKRKREPPNTGTYWTKTFFYLLRVLWRSKARPWCIAWIIR